MQQASEKLPGSGSPSSSLGIAVAAFPDAARAGADILLAGGNAVDAACAVAWALAVCEPAESGLGGQSTALVRLPDGRMIVIDGHSQAPALLRRKLVGPKAQKRGIRSATIPSTPATLGAIHRRFGRLSFAQVLEPAIRIAKEGYEITRLQRRLMKWTARHFSAGSPEESLFLKPGKGLYRVGELFRQPALAQTLTRLAREGVSDFYRGAIARDIVADMEARSGLISSDDLSGFDGPIERQPLEIEYKGHRVVSVPPPGGGIQTLLSLQLLAYMPPQDDPIHWYSRLAIATRTAFVERERWPEHPAGFSSSVAKWSVSPERARLLLAKRAGRPVDPEPPGEAGNTTHLCTADSDGMVVTMTQSIQSVFGAKVAHPRLGFVYNNYLSTCPRRRHPYRLRGGCIPQSNATPTIVLRPSGQPLLAIGAAGSRRITSSIVQVISAMVDQGMDAATAVMLPRTHALLNRSVWVEESVDQPSIEILRAHFKRLRMRPPNSYKMGAVHAIGWDQQGRPTGAADPRRDGAAAQA